MKCIILAGGKGTRISEISKDIPKPMIKILGKPIIWRIMKHYSKYGLGTLLSRQATKKKSLKIISRKKI